MVISNMSTSPVWRIGMMERRYIALARVDRSRYVAGAAP
jgi:hypothetical protein